MRRKQGFGNAVSILIMVILAITCFTHGVTKTVLYSVAFAGWGTYAISKHLVPAIQRYKLRKEGEKIANESKKPDFEFPDTSEPISHTLLLHVNHRITAFIKGLYPNGLWKWESENPELLISKGGVGRIQLFGIDEYNFADITFDSNANIECSLLKVTTLKKPSNNTAKTEEKVQSEIEPQVWFEKKGKLVLNTLVADLNSRGHKSLVIKDDGTCVISQGDKTINTVCFDGFPERVYWPRLIKVLESNGMVSKPSESGLVVSW